MELTRTQRDAVLDVFSAFDRAGVKYVVLRKYVDLPLSLPDPEIDLQIQAEYFEEALSLCQAHGFRNEHTMTSDIAELVRRAVAKPDETVRWLREEPRGTIRLITDTTKPYSRGSHGYRTVKLAFDGLVLDVKKHLAYRSPMNRERIRIDPYVEAKLFERRIERGELYVPSPPDELAHLVCHCIFDKEGSFSGYYVERCDELVEEVSKDDLYRSQFKKLLEHLFFDAADLVAGRVYDREYNSLRRGLYQFDDY